MRVLFPFPAIVGQAELKKSLLLCAINPAVGGVLIRGEKGTAKSTIVRALAEILPPLESPEGCAFGCERSRPETWCERCRQRGSELIWRSRPTPVVTLPLNATEDRVSGSLDFESAVKYGRRSLSPGLLAAAHRGIVYVDEVNLLDDHIVDIILDAAASGENRLEREGLSFRHPARFMLIGTMNPEEGELRPQFLDRFGLSVAVSGEEQAEDRVELMLRREAFDRDPAAFRARYAPELEALRLQIVQGRGLLEQIRLPKRLRTFIAELAKGSNVAGHRADLFLEQASLALAALKGRSEVTEEMVIEIAPLVLAHRRRDAAPPPPPPPPPPQEPQEPPQEPDENKERDSQENKEAQSPPPPETQSQQESPPPPPPPEENQDSGQDGAPALENIFQIGETFRVRSLQTDKDRLRRRGSGRRSRSRVSQKQGRYIKSGPDTGSGDLALDATVRAAAPHQLARRQNSTLAISLTEADIREKVREKRLGNYLFFLVDASGSMGARGRMTASKGAIMSLLLDAYQKRDRIALISFRRKEATVNLPLTTSVDLAGKLLAELPVGGRTPLSAGLSRAWQEMRNALIKNPLARPIMLIITDGRSNVSLKGNGANALAESLRLAETMALDERVKYIVVDTEEPGALSFGLAAELAGSLGAAYFKINELKAEALVNIVRRSQF